MTKPSRYILNTDYATLMNDKSATSQLTLPSIITTTAGGQSRIYSITMPLSAQPGTSMRFIVQSSRYPGKGITTSPFEIPCKVKVGGTTYDGRLDGFVYRQNGSIKLEIHAVPDDFDAQTYSQTDQTLTIQVQNFRSPFES